MAKVKGSTTGSNEMFSMINGVKTDAHLHAAMLGDDELNCYSVSDLPEEGPYTDEDFERAQELYRQRRQGK